MSFKKISWMVIFFWLSLPSRVWADCVLIVENKHTLVKSGECSKRHPPNSTFKIALALMGYQEGILLDETHPEVPFQVGFEDSLDIWKQAHNPSSWVKNSVVWYSQWLTQQMGMDTFQRWVDLFNYGNRDLTGHVGMNNALTQSWLSGSLKISPREQMFFFTKTNQHQIACECPRAGGDTAYFVAGNLAKWRLVLWKNGRWLS